jgi:hypothetical protein
VRTLIYLLGLFIAFSIKPKLCAEVEADRIWTRMDMRRIFTPYVGQWAGEWLISDVDGKVIKKIELQQQYWWEKGHLKGVMLYQDFNRVARLTSDIYLEDGKIISEVLNDDERSFYRAHPGANHVLWTPVDHEEVLKRRILEYVTDNDGVTWFISEGFERFIEEDETQTLLFRVVLRKVI